MSLLCDLAREERRLVAALEAIRSRIAEEVERRQARPQHLQLVRTLEERAVGDRP